MIYIYTEQLLCRTREKQYVQLKTKDAQAMGKFINKLQEHYVSYKRDYYIKTFSKYSINLRMTWNTIKETQNIRHKSKSRFPAEFKLSNGKIISDYKEIADAFNDYLLALVHRKQSPLQVTLDHYFDYLSNNQIAIYNSIQLPIVMWQT